MPTIKQDYHTHAVLAVADFEGTAVLVHRGGAYPTLLDDDGKQIDRLIDVAQFGDKYLITAQAGWGYGGRMQALRVGEVATLEEAALLYPAALQAIRDLPMDYQRGRSLAAEICSQGPLSREQYETLAAKHGFPALPDSKLSTWGEFSFPEYALADLPRIWAGQYRAFAVEKEEESARKEREAAAAQALAALKERLRGQPVLRTETLLAPASTPGEWLRAEKLYTVTQRVPRRITEDDPSIHGEHLLGHEGEMGAMLTVEVRGMAGSVTRPVQLSGEG